MSKARETMNTTYAEFQKGWTERLVSMIRKYHNYTMQTNQRQREEGPQNTNSHETSGGQLNNQLTLPCQDDCKTR